MFGKDVKKLTDKERELQAELERVKKIARDSKFTELEEILEQVSDAVKNDRERMERVNEALRKEGWDV